MSTRYDFAWSIASASLLSNSKTNNPSSNNTNKTRTRAGASKSSTSSSVGGSIKTRPIHRAAHVQKSRVGATIPVHNGKGFTEVQVKLDMVGFRFGEFVPTKISRQKVRLKGKSKGQVKGR